MLIQGINTYDTIFKNCNFQSATLDNISFHTADVKSLSLKNSNIEHLDMRLSGVERMIDMRWTRPNSNSKILVSESIIENMMDEDFKKIKINQEQENKQEQLELEY